MIQRVAHNMGFRSGSAGMVAVSIKDRVGTSADVEGNPTALD
jgi:hypothetical protein